MKIYDCFTFANELDVLELRLNCMYEYVDKIVLVEATKTHNKNETKPLYYQENKKRFQQFSDKIIHVIVKDMPTDIYPRSREFHQRNAIIRGLKNIENDDIIIVSDVDEILSINILQNLKNNQHDIFYFKMFLMYFKLNYICVNGEGLSVWSVGVKGNHIKNGMMPQDIRFLRFNTSFPNSTIYNNAGWHFSYIGDDNFVKNKLSHLCETTRITNELLENVNIDQFIAEGKDLFDRPGFEWCSIKINEFFPKYIINNQEKYEKYIIKNPEKMLVAMSH